MCRSSRTRRQRVCPGQSDQNCGVGVQRLVDPRTTTNLVRVERGRRTIGSPILSAVFDEGSSPVPFASTGRSQVRSSCCFSTTTVEQFGGRTSAATFGIKRARNCTRHRIGKPDRHDLLRHACSAWLNADLLEHIPCLVRAIQPVSFPQRIQVSCNAMRKLSPSRLLCYENRGYGPTAGSAQCTLDSPCRGSLVAVQSGIASVRPAITSRQPPECGAVVAQVQAQRAGDDPHVIGGGHWYRAGSYDGRQESPSSHRDEAGPRRGK